MQFAKPPISRKLLAHAVGKDTRYSPEEDELLEELNGRDNLPWKEIVKHFPGRAKGSL
jgi:hypothetical protein